jgi:flagellar biosynthesis GTPase FlhF
MKPSICFFVAIAACAAQTSGPVISAKPAAKTAPKSARAAKKAQQIEAAQQALEQAQYDKAMAEGKTIEALNYKFAALFRQAAGNKEATEKIQQALTAAIEAELAKDDAGRGVAMRKEVDEQKRKAACLEQGILAPKSCASSILK